MEKRELTCIGCPMGCALTVSLEAGMVVSVEGYTCKRGRDYGEKECTNPMRTVTSSVPVTGGAIAMVSVNYFIYRAIAKAGRKKYAGQILALSDELLGDE